MQWIADLIAWFYCLYLRTRYNYVLAFRKGPACFYVAADEKTRKAHRDENIIAHAYGTNVFARSRRALTRGVVRHELKHVQQYMQSKGWFLVEYPRELWRVGYYKNKYERAARRAEKRP